MKKYLLTMLIATMFAFIGCTEAVTDTGDNDNTKTEDTTTASYTVEHYQQNIENDEFTLVNDDTEEKSGKIGEDTKAIAKTYDGFTAKTVTQEKIADGGSTVVKIEYTRNVVTLTFDTDGGSEIESKSGKYGAELTVEAPTKEGYTFNSWNPALPTSFPAADTAYKAKWAIEGDYTITYELYEGTNAESNPVSYNVETATITLAEATKENYVFDGWYTDESFTDENKVTTIEKGSTGDITLYAKWIELITASNVAEKIKALTEKGTHTIKVTGTISSSTISEIKEALQSLSSKIYVNLDLSETTGLTSIDEKAFDDCDGLAGISIPDSVTTIGKNAFDDCDSLTSITIGDKVTSIGEKAFYDCDSLISITIGNGVTEIGNYAFYSCSKLTTATVGSGVTNVGYSIFDYCSSLTTLTINTADNCLYSKNIYNESIITLAYYDSNAKKITISDKVSYIDSDAFDYCNGIEEIVIGNGINSFDYLPIEDNTALKSITIGNKITKIDSSEFSGCTGLTSVTIGSGVTTLYGSAFSDCKNLESVIIDENNTSFKSSGNYILSKDGTKLVFWFGNLTELTIPDGITSISGGAFYNCTDLTNVTIPNSVTSISSSAFSGCTGLTSMTIPNSVTSIGNYAFKNCTGLTSMTIPDSVTSIGAAAFQNCTNLTSVTIGSGLSSSYPSMFNGCTNLTTLTVSDSNTYLKSNGNCIYNKDETKFILCANGLTEVTILDTVTAIGGSAFYGCTNLTNVTIPSGVTKIDSSTFQGCTSLTSVTIPSGVTAIGYSAFEGCTSLANVTIPSGVTEIASSTFSGCTSLTSITIPSGVTKIANSTFNDCTGLTSVTIPENVTEIDGFAFSGCTGLTSVTIPANVTKIAWYAFQGCTNLESITFADTTSTWYYTSSSDYTDGTAINVTDAATNATNLTSTFSYYSKYWYKEASSIE